MSTKRTRKETGRGLVSKLKGFTDATMHRHYYPSHEEWQIVEAGSVIKLDMVGQAEILLDRDECEDLSRLLRHFADHGTLPAPWKQEPSYVMEDPPVQPLPTLDELQKSLQIEADKIATQTEKEITPGVLKILIQLFKQLGITNLEKYAIDDNN